MNVLIKLIIQSIQVTKYTVQNMMKDTDLGEQESSPSSYIMFFNNKFHCHVTTKFNLPWIQCCDIHLMHNTVFSF